MPVSAHRLLAGLVRKAPVAIRRVEFCIGSRRLNCEWGARPQIGEALSKIARTKEEYSGIRTLRLHPYLG